MDEPSGTSGRPSGVCAPDVELGVVLVVVEEGDGVLHRVERLVDVLEPDSIGKYLLEFWFLHV